MDQERRWVEAVLYGTGHKRRFTQDSAILTDVWCAYLANPNSAIGLLIEPWLDRTAFDVASILTERMTKTEPTESAKRHIAANRTVAYAKLTLRQLVRDVVAYTGWYVGALPKRSSAAPAKRTKSAAAPKKEKSLRLPTAKELWEDLNRPEYNTYPYTELLGFIRMAGIIVYVAEHGPTSPVTLLDALAGVESTEAIARARQDLSDIILKGATMVFGAGLVSPPEGVGKLIYSINRNRPAVLAIHNSIRTVKADAACSLFSINCSKLAWAIIDCGIDARHPAFFDPSKLAPSKAGKSKAPPEPSQQQKLDASRVTATYDFSYFREFLLNDTDVPGFPSQRLAKLKSRRKGESAKAHRERLEYQAETIRRIRIGRQVSWGSLRDFIRVPHDETYTVPHDGHGTHVAGILGADWRSATGASRMKGLCPDIKLIDVRVCKPDGSSDEFCIISALQFLRSLNSNADTMAVHGANLSLSLEADVASFACGRTPICVEAERNVSSGMVIVAAAGNHGYRRAMGEEGRSFPQYFSSSITDPGNAEGVITVGSTHRLEPHNYGVSYFSSRGPTGDGRNKPDLVAPGEKIYAPTLGDEAVRLDGTSMAAPHVSGAAAMLMARHVELTGRPDKIKKILCSTTTDLGRERYFQGHGLLDILRALQSV